MKKFVIGVVIFLICGIAYGQEQTLDNVCCFAVNANTEMVFLNGEVIEKHAFEDNILSIESVGNSLLFETVDSENVHHLAQMKLLNKNTVGIASGDFALISWVKNSLQPMGIIVHYPSIYLASWRGGTLNLKTGFQGYPTVGTIVSSSRLLVKENNGFFLYDMDLNLINVFGIYNDSRPVLLQISETEFLSVSHENVLQVKVENDEVLVSELLHLEGFRPSNMFPFQTGYAVYAAPYGSGSTGKIVLLDENYVQISEVSISKIDGYQGFAVHEDNIAFCQGGDLVFLDNTLAEVGRNEVGICKGVVSIPKISSLYLPLISN